MNEDISILALLSEIRDGISNVADILARIDTRNAGEVVKNDQRNAHVDEARARATKKSGGPNA